MWLTALLFSLQGCWEGEQQGKCQICCPEEAQNSFINQPFFPFWIPKSFKERALTDSTSLLPGGCSPLPLATGGVQKILSKPLTAQRQVRDVLFTGKVRRDNKHILHSCPMTSSRLAQCIAGSELRNGSRVPLLFPKRSFPPHTEERMRFPVTPSLRRLHRKEDMQFREQAKTISC